MVIQNISILKYFLKTLWLSHYMAVNLLVIIAIILVKATNLLVIVADVLVIVKFEI